MSENKAFIIKKVTPGSVYTIISPMSNPTATRVLELTDRVPQQVLPADWALGFIMNQGNYSLYKNGYVTFDDNDGLSKLAVESGVWFDSMDFVPAESDQTQKILEILKTGNRANIIDAVDKYGRDAVLAVATYNVEQLTTAVVSMLETLLKAQLVID